ncbi:hypothetical protein RSOLAG22IIIB_08632 [Rhizoctonia solani]|uniref:Uncharacterized protein n=1 Tax=Rhizoctonia solani TaxID=456999 RepID=A0A0K6FTU5_9AGAM|nr:hypothetical protein RSOLAG22IIIB_08632 [Rhizoctonia solani]
MDDDYKYARPIGGHQSTQGRDFFSARPDPRQHIQMIMEEWRKIRTDPQAASTALGDLQSDFREYGKEKRFNHDGFYVESEDGAIRSRAERDRFYDATKAHLNSYQARLNDIPTHGDPGMERNKATMAEGIKARREQLEEQRRRYD